MEGPFLLKTIIWTWIFFQVLHSVVFKNEKQNLLTKDCWQKKDWKRLLKKEKEKREMKKIQNSKINIF